MLLCVPCLVQGRAACSPRCDATIVDSSQRVLLASLGRPRHALNMKPDLINANMSDGPRIRTRGCASGNYEPHHTGCIENRTRRCNVFGWTWVEQVKVHIQQHSVLGRDLFCGEWGPRLPLQWVMHTTRYT